MWDYTVEYTAWLKNRAPTLVLLYSIEDLFVLTSVTLFRVFTGKQPKFKNLKVYSYKAIPR